MRTKEVLTNEKYKAGLKEMLKLILLETFIGKKFILRYKFPSVLTVAACDLHFITPIAVKGRKVIYKANYKPEEVTDEMADRLRTRTNLLISQQRENKKQNPITTVETPNPKNAIIVKQEEDITAKKINLNVNEIMLFTHENTKLKEPLYLVDADTVKFKPLSDWSDEHLLMELANRDYTGKLERITGNNLFETVETITLNKR